MKNKKYQIDMNTNNGKNAENQFLQHWHITGLFKQICHTLKYKWQS